MIVFAVTTVTSTIAINAITQGVLVSTILFGAIAYEIIPKPLKFK